MAKGKPKPPALTDDQIRQIMLQYFHDRNKRATSPRGKRTGAAVSISVLRADLKDTHGLKAQEVVGNLTYLISQGWVEEKPLAKSYTTNRGAVVPSVTPYYIITAPGIDKISGPSEFMRERFQGIKIEASGQNIITLGNGNLVNIRFQQVGEALSELREVIKASKEIDESTKIDLVGDINSLQDQLAKSRPNKTVIQNLWDGIQKAAAVTSLLDAVSKVAPLIQRIVETSQ